MPAAPIELPMSVDLAIAATPTVAYAAVVAWPLSAAHHTHQVVALATILTLLRLAPFAAGRVALSTHWFMYEPTLSGEAPRAGSADRIDAGINAQARKLFMDAGLAGDLLVITSRTAKMRRASAGAASLPRNRHLIFVSEGFGRLPPHLRGPMLAHEVSHLTRRTLARRVVVRALGLIAAVTAGAYVGSYLETLSALLVVLTASYLLAELPMLHIEERRADRYAQSVFGARDFTASLRRAYEVAGITGRHGLAGRLQGILDPHGPFDARLSQASRTA